MDVTKEDLKQALKAAETLKLKAETTKLHAEIAKLKAEQKLTTVKRIWNPVLVVSVILIVASAALHISFNLCH
ncbi:hypothetical protein [Pseudomonas japonica]|uniref:hypothetical protein n=1 Tax=Pseudomonas japonica TaxID=256466 RepID=UPI0015E3E941|nr:hypothetical protein [Pseudomonas japonica]MBA1245262.1 hypothetical protein [Pseudomonas japonica]